MKQFASSSNGVDHGDLSSARNALSAGSDGTSVIFGGGWTGSNYLNVCNLKQFSSTATAVDHGDLSVARRYFDAASGTA